MKWEKQNSDSFEDRRGMSGGKKAILGGGAIGIIILLLNMFWWRNRTKYWEYFRTNSRNSNTNRTNSNQRTNC
jgi:flagellar biosynthesis/type III secretory pathway M-ring protein FliF/YscJ